MANSSATRISGLYGAIELPSTTSAAFEVRRANAAAMIFGQGIRLNQVKFHAPLPKVCNNSNSSVNLRRFCGSLTRGGLSNEADKLLALPQAQRTRLLPQGKLRWWLLGLIVLGWAVEQYEALKNGPVLVYILADFDKTLVEWGYVAAFAGLVYSIGAMFLSRATDRFRPSAADDLAGFSPML